LELNCREVFKKTEGKTMKLIKCKRSILILISLALIFALGVMTSIAQEKQIRDFLKGKVTTPGAQATAETLSFKGLNHVTKVEMVPIADVEGHAITLTLREGVVVFENGELAWSKNTFIRDLINGAGTGDAYFTYTFLDGSSITARMKGTLNATPQGVTSGTKWTGDIIHGTGKFQGIKGTFTSLSKRLPLEKGEAEAKSLFQGTLVYTLPGK
jgi:hypothetical protein